MAFIFGTFDRFTAFIIEETKGAFPTWLAPVQVKVLPITDNQKEYAKTVVAELEKAGLRVELDDRQEKIGYKIREAQLQKTPYMLIIGEKEAQNNAVGVRTRKEGDVGQMPLNEFVQKITAEVANFER